MARHVLIIEKSHMARRLLQSRTLAILDDVILSEAASIEEAQEMLENSTIHLILYGWEPGDDAGITFCCEYLKTTESERVPSVFLVNGTKEAVKDLKAKDIENYVLMPCSADDLAASIDMACHPTSLRETKRYCISGASGLIEQRKLSINCNILNVSLGGMLCEFEMEGQFNCIDPVMISANFGTGSFVRSVESIYAILSNLKVIERNSDFTPRLVRMGFKFLNVPEKSLELLANILDQAEIEDDSE